MSESSFMYNLEMSRQGLFHEEQPTNTNPMTDLSPEEQRRIEDLVKKHGAKGTYNTFRFSAIREALTEQALSHAREKEQMKAEVADYTSTTEKAFASLSAERDELKRRVEELEKDYADLLVRPDELVQQCDEIKAQFMSMEERDVEQQDRISSLEAALKGAQEERDDSALNLSLVCMARDQYKAALKAAADAIQEIQKLVGFPHGADITPVPRMVQQALTEISRLTGAPKEG